VSHNVPGDDDNTVLIMGARMNAKRSSARIAKTTVMLSCLIQERALDMFFLPIFANKCESSGGSAYGATKD
jgi:hypothetical protein